MTATHTGFELRHLDAFLAVAEERSFRGAARRLGFAPSAVSEQLAALETRVGERLLERSPGARTVGLTPAGERLAGHARAIVERVGLAERDLALARERPADALRLGVFQSVGARLLPAALAAASRRTRLDVRLVQAERPLELLRSGGLDLAFAEEPPDGDGLRHLRLLDDPYVLLVPAADPLAREPAIGLERLAALPLLTFDGCSHLRRVEAGLARRGVRLDPVLRSDDAPTLHGLVASGAGYALLPRLAVDAADRRVRALTLAEPLSPRRISLAWHGERAVTSGMRALLAGAREAAARIG